MISGTSKAKYHVSWLPPPSCFLKFNMDGAVRGRPGQEMVVLFGMRGKVLFMLSKLVGAKDFY